MSLPSVTHSFNKYLLSTYGVLGTRDKVFAQVELAGQWGEPRNKENNSIMLLQAVSWAVKTIKHVMDWFVPHQALQMGWSGQASLKSEMRLVQRRWMGRHLVRLFQAES